MDGLEVCRRLKANEALREIPVIFLTALSSTEDKVKAFEAGGADFISKPFQIDEVLARVRVHVGLRQSRAQLLESYRRLQSLERLRE
jgi:DNA-binding response OmpR family regulator